MITAKWSVEYMPLYTENKLFYSLILKSFYSVNSLYFHMIVNKKKLHTL